jgi:methyl-accepting chemotaxis protein
MKEIVVFTAIVIGMVAVLIPALYLIFRRSVLRIIGAITIVLAGMGALLAYIVATIGLVQLLWIAPVAIVIILFALRYIKRRLTNPIHLLSDDIRQKLSQGDLTFTFDRNLLIRGDELGDISNSLEDLKNKTGQIIQDIKQSAFR